MTKLTFTLLLGWLLLLSSGLVAQNKEGRFHLKEGDWFEVQVTNMDRTNTFLRYLLKKQLSNNNQKYRISFEHYIENFSTVQSRSKYALVENWGYDSYYPEYEEDKIAPQDSIQYTLEVSPIGKIIDFKPLKTNRSLKITLNQISSLFGINNFIVYSNGLLPDSSIIRSYSNMLMDPVHNSEVQNGGKVIAMLHKLKRLSDSIPNKIFTHQETGVPLLIKTQLMKFALTNASFPINGNSIIQGNIKDQFKKDVIISMIGENSAWYFPEKKFKSGDDGSFSCPIFLKRPLHLRVQVGDKSLTTFMEPGDTLNIAQIGHQAIQLLNDHFKDTKPKEYFSKELQKSDYFSGTAAYNTMLSNELDQYKNYFSYDNSIPYVIDYCQKTSKTVNELIDSYRGKASVTCIEYFQKDLNFFLSVDKLNFGLESILPKIDALQKLAGISYPENFFMAVDTLPILLNPFEWNSSYQSYIQKSQLFKQKRLGWAVGKRVGVKFPVGDNFLENYYFSQASLKGYPLYNQLAILIDQELKNGLSENNVIEHYYKDFVNNCEDPALTEPLNKVYESAIQLKIGNQFPIHSFILQDHSIFKLDKLKGKPICLILLDNTKSSVNAYQTEFEKFRTEEVEFVIAGLLNADKYSQKFKSPVLEKSNVTFIDLAEQNLKSKLLLKGTKIFMLDKWFRIVENNAEDPMTHSYNGGPSKFELSLRKTIEAEHYSKAEKTAMVKTAGWIFGSVLLTALIGFWIYRIRIGRIREQETVKRRIKELEIKAIRSQMNPHFIFNALNSIQSLINGNQFKEANIYLSKFAVLLRGVLNNSEKNRISLSDELQAVELYCQLEQLRFEFKFEISIDPEVNCDLVEIPGMIIQPLAENAIVHGLSAKGDQGQLNIRVERQNGNLCVGVADNGVGLSPEFSDFLSQKGFGLKLVEERINILNLDGKEARLTVTNNRNNIGTTATLTLPID